MRRAAIAGVLWLCLAASMGGQTTVGQTATPDRPGPWVVDLRGATVSLPQDAAFFPDVPSSTAVPSRGYGLDVGAHIYVLQLGPARLGIGGMLLRARGTASPGEPDEDEDEEPSPTGLATTPDVAALLTTVGPQISMNFGSRAGWSYLSAGIGRARMSTRASRFVDEDDEDDVTAAQLMEHGSRSSLNFGGGARWFTRERLAVSFDVRFHIIGAGGEEPATPGSTLLAASVGVSLR
jgi:hypothetical protein